MLTMYQQITIKTLHNQGVRNTQIAKDLGCHRNTVVNVLQRNVIEKQTRSKPSVFSSLQPKIKELLDKKITNIRIFEILTEEYGIKSTYVNLCKYIQKYLPKQREAFGVQINESGETAEIDFGYLGMFPGPLGKLVKTYGLVVILNFSRLSYFAITYDQKLETLIKCLEAAFFFFNGVPKRLKVDNMKTAILKNQHYDLEFNQDFLEFANHYNTVIVACTPHAPQQKGTVEAGIKYLQNNFVCGRTFVDAADMRRQLTDWMVNYANRRIHGTTRQIPQEVFENMEKDKLQRLPNHPFAFFNRGVRTVAQNCHIHFENNYYSVPSSLVGKEVTVRWNERLIRIIYQGEQVALHTKINGIGQYQTQRSHLPSFKIYSQTEYQARFEKEFIDMGEEAQMYFNTLLSGKDAYWARTARIILGLRKTYGDMAVNASLKRALYYKAFDVTTIKNILEKRLYEIPFEPKLLDTTNTITTKENSSFQRELNYYASSL
jgi:transposase